MFGDIGADADQAFAYTRGSMRALIGRDDSARRRAGDRRRPAAGDR
jgi:hypothetical protein